MSDPRPLVPDWPFVLLNGRLIHVTSTSIGGSHLREVLGIPDDHDLWQEPAGISEDVLVTDRMIFHIPLPLRFHSAPKEINGG